VTTFASEDHDLVRAAMANAKRVLHERPGRGPLFLEDRTDLRVLIGSDEEQDLIVTRSRGAAAGDHDSLHVTAPSLDDLEALARGEIASIPFPGALVPRAPESPAAGQDSGWISAAVASIVDQAERGVRGIPGTRWSATMVAFSQTVWVATIDREISVDTRRGCRIELRIAIEGHPNSSTVQDCVIGWGSEALPAGIVERGVERADRKRGIRPASRRGTRCAVMAPGAGGVVIHELVGHALEGDVVDLRTPWILCGPLPESGRRLTIIDDPRRGRGAWQVDDEGEPAAETVLVADGRPTGLILDRGTARALRKQSTGHGRRSSYLTATRPRMGCTFIDSGADDPRDVVRETRDGLFIHRVTAGHTDPDRGRASFLVSEADEITSGVVGAPVEPFVIELDGRQMWETLDRVGHDLAFDTCVGSCIRDGQPLAVSVGAPTIRIGVMSVVS
jgi:TldD protein